MKDMPTPEQLHAYLDGELTAEERTRFLAVLEADPESRMQACELRTLKDLVQGAYAEVPRAKTPVVRQRPSLGWAMAAGLLLALGLGGGWLARDLMPGNSGPERLAGLPSGFQAISLANEVDPGKIILHLDSGDPLRLNQALDMAERLLKIHGPAARVEIVANSYGLDLLRADVTPLAPRIADMARRHANLSFVACGQTVARLKREGVKVSLVPDAHTASSAINEIMTRMGQGWVYVKV